MTKAELILELAICNKLGTRAAAGRILISLKNIISREIKAGNSVALGNDFGVFKSIAKPAKSGTAMGKSYNKPASKAIKFNSSAAFKRAIN